MANKSGRTTVYNAITSEEKLKQVNKKNLELQEDFLEYLSDANRSPQTIKQYRSKLNIFWIWNLENNGNKFFVDIKKREFSRFQGHCQNEWKLSPKSVRMTKAVLSSLSNFIQNMLEDEFEGYRPIVNKIESPVNVAVREKSVFTQEEIKEALNKVIEDGKYEMACVIALALYSGRRKAELTRFKVSYFDDSNLICGGSLYKTPEKVKTKGRGSIGKMLDIYILAKQFKPYLDLWMEQRKELGIDSEWLFPNEENKDEHINDSNMNTFARNFEVYLDKPFYMHSLRHNFVTTLLEQNLPETIVQNIIGWSSSEMIKIYDDRTIDAQLDAFFGEDGIKQVETKSLSDL